MIKAGTIVVSIALLFIAIPLLKAEMIWNKTAKASLTGKTEEMLPEYDRLYRYLGKNGLFLYNHAAELHAAKEYEKSIAVFEQCMRYYNDMDVQMLLADNYKKFGKYAETEQHLKAASAMCPVRFMPLYELAKLYDATGRRDEALILAKDFINKDVKVNSHTIDIIKKEMSQLIETPETPDVSEKDNRTNDEFGNDKTRQGEMPEIQPLGIALPP